MGIPSDLGRIEVWFEPTPGAPPAGPFGLLAKFPQRDPPGNPVPVLLGLEFFLTHVARAEIAPPPADSSIWMP